MINFVSGIPIGPLANQVGMVVIGWPSTSPFYLNSYSQTSSLVSAIQNVPYVQRWTNLANGLRETINNQFTTTRGDRLGFPNVAIVIMATQADQGLSDELAAAQAAWNAGIAIVSVGVTANVNQTELMLISSAPHTANVNYFIVSNPSALSTISTALSNSVFSGLYSLK